MVYVTLGFETFRRNIIDSTDSYSTLIEDVTPKQNKINKKKNTTSSEMTEVNDVWKQGRWI